MVPGQLDSLPSGGLAIVVGATGGLGAALLSQLERDTSFARAVGLSRHSQPALRRLFAIIISVGPGRISHHCLTAYFAKRDLLR